MLNIIFFHYAIVDKQGFGRTFMLARELTKLGNKVVLITTQPFGKFAFPFIVEIRDEVKIISFFDILPNNLRRTGFAFFSAILKLAYIIKHHQYDLIFSDIGHRPSAAFPAFLMQLIFRIPHFTEWWDYFGRGGQYDNKSLFKKLTHGNYDLLFQPFFLKKATGVIVLSEFLKQKALDLNISSNKILLLNGGADTSKIIYFHDNKLLKDHYGFPPNSLTFAYIGMNSVEFEDIIPFILSVNNLKSNYPINWFTTGEYIDNATKEKYSIGSELKEFGWLDYKVFSNVIGCADVFILIQKENINNTARWPNKVGDYFAAGRLILTNPVGEITAITIKYPKAFKLTTPLEYDISKSIIDLYKNQYQLPAIGKYIRDLATTELSWEKKAMQLELFFHQSIIKVQHEKEDIENPQ